MLSAIRLPISRSRRLNRSRSALLGVPSCMRRLVLAWKQAVASLGPWSRNVRKTVDRPLEILRREHA